MGVKRASPLALCLKVRVGDTSCHGEGLLPQDSCFISARAAWGGRCQPDHLVPLHGRWETQALCSPSSPGVPSQPIFLFPPLRFLQFVCCIVSGGS